MGPFEQEPGPLPLVGLEKAFALSKIGLVLGFFVLYMFVSNDSACSLVVRVYHGGVFVG